MQLRLGNWGYVVRAVGGDWQSSGARLGYNAEAAVEQFGQLGDISGSVVRNLTYTLILHPSKRNTETMVQSLLAN